MKDLLIWTVISLLMLFHPAPEPRGLWLMQRQTPEWSPWHTRSSSQAVAAAAADGSTLGQGWERAGFHPLLCSASVRAWAAEAAADGARGTPVCE